MSSPDRDVEEKKTSHMAKNEVDDDDDIDVDVEMTEDDPVVDLFGGN